MLNMGLRIIICVPIGAVVAVLMFTVIGIPIGFVIGLAAGAWITAPIRRHPAFNVKGDAE